METAGVLVLLMLSFLGLYLVACCALTLWWLSVWLRTRRMPQEYEWWSRQADWLFSLSLVCLGGWMWLLNEPRFLGRPGAAVFVIGVLLVRILNHWAMRRLDRSR